MCNFIFCRIENHFCPPRKKMYYSIKKENINLFLNKLKNIYNVIYYAIRGNKLVVIIYNYNYFLYYNPNIEDRKNAINKLISQTKNTDITVLFSEKIFQER